MPYTPRPRNETLTFTGDLQSLVKRADSGDAQATAELCSFLDENPTVWEEMGDLARHAERAQIAVAAGDNTMLAESIRRNAARLRQEVTRLPTEPLEGLLVDRVVISWIQLCAAEAQGDSLQRTDRPSRDLEKRLDEANALVRGGSGPAASFCASVVPSTSCMLKYGSPSCSPTS